LTTQDKELILKLMSKKALVVILVLSVVVTYGVAFADVLKRNSFLAGEAGLPFRFSSSYFLVKAQISYS